MSAILHSRALSAGILCFATVLAPVGPRAQCRPDQRRVTVRDSIRMAEVVPAAAGSAAHGEGVASISSDGRHFALVLSKGDLRTDTNVFTLILYSKQQAFYSARPEFTLRMSSKSNRAAISGLRWLKNSRTLLFLGEEPRQPAQIYSFDLSTGRLKQLTHHATAIVRYDSSDDGGTIVFEAEPAPEDILDTRAARQDGFVVAGQPLSTLLFSGCRSSRSMSFVPRQLFVMSRHQGVRRVDTDDAVWPFLTLSVSPHGRHALIGAFVRHVPAEWALYSSPLLHEIVAAAKPQQAFSEAETYLLLDTRTARLSPLFDAPKDWPNDGSLWLDGGRALVVSHAWLPLREVTGPERTLRESQPFVVEVSLPSRRFTTIGQDDLTASDWNQAMGEITLEGSGRAASLRRTWRRRGDRWDEVPQQAVPTSNSPTLKIVQDMNTPPTVWLSDPVSGRSLRLLDPNPQFAHLCFGHETEITWNATDGHPMHGGLYLPPDYLTGRRYPLVIQTHAFDPGQFWIDGPWNSAFAAQPLAAKDMVVLQMGYDQVGAHTPEEAPRAMAAIDGAIDALAGRGIVDPERVGIIGFSRTVYHVAYTLTHSAHRFAAATLADGFDGGYVQTIDFSTTEGSDAIAVNGGPPYGPTLTGWIAHSPLFSVAGVDTPVRLEAYGMDSVLEMWPWYSLLSERRMPVDMLILPRASHLLVKPWERLASQQGNVDWFSFWLRGQEDSAPEKAEQYRRWELLRRSFHASAASALVGSGR